MQTTGLGSKTGRPGVPSRLLGVQNVCSVHVRDNGVAVQACARFRASVRKGCLSIQHEPVHRGATDGHLALRPTPCCCWGW